MNTFLPIAASGNSTVVAEYDPPARKEKSYQSEAELEKGLIAQLQKQEYEYLPVKTEADLVNNLRAQLESLNDIRFADDEWARFFTGQLANPSQSILDKTAIIQANPAALPLERNDGSQKNIHLIDKENIHRNRLQVINQYESTGNFHNRYDVTILVNGLPMVHIELKRRGVALREAFNQINRYQRDSFWAGSRLFQYAQLFVISNGTYTKVLLQHHPLLARQRSQPGQGRRGELRVHLVVDRRPQQPHHRPDRLHQDVPVQAHAAERDH